MNDEYVTVTVTVPGDRVPEFYGAFSAWLSGKAVMPPAEPPEKAARWKAGDEEAAADFYRAISANARRVLDSWAERPDDWITGDATAQAAGLNGPKGVAGSLSSVGKASTKMCRALPFEHRPGAPGTSGSYRMRPDVAELFRRAKQEVER